MHGQGVHRPFLSHAGVKEPDEAHLQIPYNGSQRSRSVLAYACRRAWLPWIRQAPSQFIATTIATLVDGSCDSLTAMTTLGIMAHSTSPAP
jgi:hypothetical protein